MPMIWRNSTRAVRFARLVVMGAAITVAAAWTSARAAPPVTTPAPTKTTAPTPPASAAPAKAPAPPAKAPALPAQAPAAPSAAPADIPAFDGVPRVLVFSRTLGFRHKSIPAGTQAIREILAGRFVVDDTEDPTRFCAENLRRYHAVIFLSTTGDVLNDAQQAAFEEFIRAGGGYAGVHAAADTEYAWPWYGQLVGAYFMGHPPVQPAVVLIEDRMHPSTRMLPQHWARTDEWYAFKTNPRAQVHVLASLDEGSYQPGEASMHGDHPIAWCHEFEGGRAWYTALGHTDEAFQEPLLRAHLREGITWAAGGLDPEDGTPRRLPVALPATRMQAPAAPSAPTAPAAPRAPAATPAGAPTPAPRACAGGLPAHATLALAASVVLQGPVQGMRAREASATEAPLTAPAGSMKNALLLGSVMLVCVAVLGAINGGLRPAILAWLWPGAGYLALGYRRRGVLAMIGVLGMVFIGVLLGGIDAVDSNEDAAWFIPQAANGPLVFVIDAADQTLLKTGRIGTLLPAPPQMDPTGRPLPGEYLVSSYKGLGPANEFGTLFIALAGMMNMLLVMDASRREPTDRADA